MKPCLLKQIDFCTARSMQMAEEPTTYLIWFTSLRRISNINRHSQKSISSTLNCSISQLNGTSPCKRFKFLLTVHSFHTVTAHLVWFQVFSGTPFDIASTTFSCDFSDLYFCLPLDCQGLLSSGSCLIPPAGSCFCEGSYSILSSCLISSSSGIHNSSSISALLSALLLLLSSGSSNKDSQPMEIGFLACHAQKTHSLLQYIDDIT